MKRKLLATLLALCLIVGMIPVAASAEIIRVEDTETLWNEETDSFRIYDDYWSDIVAEIPEGYVQDEVQKTVQLSTPESLVWFGKEINSGKSFAGYTITVTNDIDMSGHYWTPIDTETIQYNDENGSWSTIDPQKKLDGATITGGEEGHTITGLATSTGLRGPNQSSEPGDGQNCYYYSAFIGRNDGALTVQNLTFENASIAMTEPDDGVASNGSSMCATVVALNSGTLTLDSVSVVGSNILAMQKAAALVAYTTSSLVVQQCEVEDNTISAYFQVAPVVGYSAKNNLSLKGIVLNNNTIRAIEQQGDSWNYTIDEEGNQYYQYGNDNLWYYNAGEVAVFYDGESDSSTQGSGLEMVAEVNGYQYSTIQSAIESAEAGETVTLLKDTTENVTIASGKDLQLDLNGKTLTETTYMDVQGVLTIKDSTATSAPQISSDYETVTYQSGKIVNTGTGILVSNGGELTLESGCVHSTSGNGINVNGNTNMEGWDNAIDSSVTITGGYVHSREYGIGVYGNGAVVNVEGGVVVADDNGAIAGNGSYNSDSNGDGVTDNYGGTEINIRGGTVIGHIVSPGYIAVGIYHPQNGELNISGGTIYADNGVGICIRNGSLNISENAQLYASGNEAGKVGDAANEIPGKTVVIDYSTGYNHGNETTDSRTVKIEGGYFSAEQNNVEVYTTEGNKIIDNFITGGNFTHDPSEYLAEGKVAVPSTVAGYSYTVADKEETSAEVSVAAPNVAKPVAEGTEEDQALANAVYSALTDSESATTGPSIDESALKAAANAVANDTNGTVTDQIVEDLKQATSNDEIAADDVTIVIQPYLDIQITDVDATSGSETITLDVTPMYRTVATTADLSEDSDEEIILSGSGEEDTVNAVQIGTAQPLTVNNTVTVTIPLPENFAQGGGELFVRHVKSDNRVYFYTGSVEDNVLTFTNPNGFSEMTISKTNGAVAEIDGVGYATLTQALNEAQDGDTVTILEDGLTATMSGSERSITLKDGTNDSDSNSISLIINGQKIEIKDGETETFTYTPPTGGGTPSEPEEPTWPFTDVTEGEDWFYDAVAYVYENGIMAGTDETIFDPYMELDRAMAAQLFYNLEGKPAVTGDSTFTDVTSGHWAVDAITWAAQNDIVAGIGGGLYDPDSNVTREQFAVMLYKYARFKGYDLTATGDLTQFPDAGSISSWAETALSWANGNGLINGHENGTIDPKGSTIRAQAASIMANFDQNVAK